MNSLPRPSFNLPPGARLRPEPDSEPRSAECGCLLPLWLTDKVCLECQEAMEDQP
jgi:hypothetical protein